MTNQLYYHDPYLISFSSIIEQTGKDSTGFYIVLSETAFYATGGGQPYDTGTINGVPVTQVEKINGEIRHYLLQEISPHEKIVTGQVHWQRRFDHMQQHAAQHLLTRAFIELFQIDTLSFHLGATTCTIDIDTEFLDEETALEAETFANNIVFENRPITTQWITKDEVEHFPLHKQPSVSENIRLVIIKDFDYNACGGIHPATTGEVGPIKILSWERHKKKTRLLFVAGKRTISVMTRYQQILTETALLLKTKQDNIPSKVDILLQKERELSTCKEQLLQLEANTYIHDSKELITASFPNRSIQELQQLATLITKAKKAALVCFATKNEQHLQFILAKGKGTSIPLKEVGKQLLTLIEGKGGGNNMSIRGGGETSLTGEEFIHHAQTFFQSEFCS